MKGILNSKLGTLSMSDLEGERERKEQRALRSLRDYIEQVDTFIPSQVYNCTFNPFQ